MSKFDNLKNVSRENGRCLICHGLGYKVTIVKGKQTKVPCLPCRGSGKKK